MTFSGNLSETSSSAKVFPLVSGRRAIAIAPPSRAATWSTDVYDDDYDGVHDDDGDDVNVDDADNAIAIAPPSRAATWS